MSSKQLEMVKEIFAKHGKEIQADILATANMFMLENISTLDYKAYVLIFNEGLFTPWLDRSEQYAEYVAEFGNVDDECQWLSTIWEQTLIENSRMLLKITNILSGIRINGI